MAWCSRWSGCHRAPARCCTTRFPCRRRASRALQRFFQGARKQEIESCCLFRLLRLHSACCLLPCQEVARFLLGELFLSFLFSRVNICILVVMCGGSFLDVLDALNGCWIPGRKGMPCQEVAVIFFVCTWMVAGLVLCSGLTWQIELLVARVIDVLPGCFG
ncbi:hypothetical protein ACQJBY_030951 [Aegilops geniculata]